MEIYFHAQTREYDYENATQELELIIHIFRRLYTNFKDYIQLQMSI